MTANEIRDTFLDFFRDKGHKIVSSAPIVTKDDPTLMFTNAGMNQFKDYFLGTRDPEATRIADTQKCLRVSGKHNDLEEVGRDSYHHTMFEMLGNWSFGDYFKEEAINWAWELLIDKLGLDPERLYASVFEGDANDNLDADEEAADIWKTKLPASRVLYFDRKDNFWEMGSTGPCGPCSEIHVDLRSDEARAQMDGRELVNQDHPLVIEIWNLVFIQYNRKADGRLEELPAKHVDTGMGFERLCMALQGKSSNYDTDVFSHTIEKIERDTGKKYTSSYDPSAHSDIAMRVISDHIRAVAFAIADGELPGNSGAGYVIRRILRRAVRYYYSFLDLDRPYMHELVPMLAEQFSDVFPELKAQEAFVTNVILEEEKSFLRTLEDGLKRIDQLDVKGGVVDGKDAFELYDTYGFPLDLTQLIASERNLKVDIEGFKTYLSEQKQRSRADAEREVGDWIEIRPMEKIDFIGYDVLEAEGCNILRMRQIKIKGKTQHQIVLDKTPFYPEGGGQIGDTGIIHSGGQSISVIDTVKDNELILHVVDMLPSDPTLPVSCFVYGTRRHLIENNHSATHLMHAALRDVLGDHVQQKGSLVADNYLRFDFSHFQKVSDEELHRIETIVNERIRQNIVLNEARSIPIEDAKKAGAMMLFGEKYGDEVRMITFDPDYSIELCGGCHVDYTGRIGTFKIVSEGAVAAGVRRIEAVTAQAAESYINEKINTLDEVKDLLKSPDVLKSIKSIIEENKSLKKKIDSLAAKQAGNIKGDLLEEAQQIGDYTLIAKVVQLQDSKALKNLVFQLQSETSKGMIALAADIGGKPQLMLSFDKDITESTELNAGQIIREAAGKIKGGGGGQPFFASAGGSDASGLDDALKIIVTRIKEGVA